MGILEKIKGFFGKKPHIHRILSVWEEKGVDCWLMPYKDFNCLYNRENVIRQPDGRICSTITFANNPIIVYRQEKNDE
jgi:hypothetical protein